METCELQEHKETVKDKIRHFKQNMKWKVESWLQKNAMSIIKWTEKDSNYIKHAKREFLALGYIPADILQEDGPNQWIQNNIIDLLAVLSTQGHSGGSIGYAVNAFKKLATFDTLTSIKCTDDEWNHVGRMMDGDHYQNNRLSSVFKKGKDGAPYYLNAIVFRGQNGYTFTGSSVLDSSGKTITSSQNIKLPFVPKTFYIDVIDTEWADKEETVEQEGGGWWTSKIKDVSQLDDVFEYYVKGK